MTTDLGGMTGGAVVAGAVSSYLTAPSGGAVLPDATANAAATSAATSEPTTTGDIASTPTVVSASRYVSDPLARVMITQYLDVNSQVVAQTPPSTVVAYLQNGLTPQGFPKTSSVA